MKETGIMAMWMLAFVGGLAIGAYLVMHDHPWFALLVILIAGSVSVRSKGDGPEGKIE